MRCSLLVAKLDMIMVHWSQKASNSNKESLQMNVSYQVEEVELDRRELCGGNYSLAAVFKNIVAISYDQK